MGDNIASQSASSTVKSFFGAITGTFGVFVALGVCCVLTVIFAGFAGESAQEQEKKTEEVTSKEYKVGERVEIDNISLIVNEYIDNVPSNNEFIQPAEGNKFIAVDATVKNTGSGSEFLSQSDFTVQDSSSYKYEATFHDFKTPTFATNTIGKDGTIRGWVIFEVPTDIRSPKLVFKTGFWTTKEIKVKL